MENKSHEDAVNVLRAAGMSVRLLVQKDDGLSGGGALDGVGYPAAGAQGQGAPNDRMQQFQQGPRRRKPRDRDRDRSMWCC